jgi:hypothetical protein
MVIELTVALAPFSYLVCYNCVWSYNKYFNCVCVLRQLFVVTTFVPSVFSITKLAFRAFGPKIFVLVAF